MTLTVEATATCENGHTWLTGGPLPDGRAGAWLVDHRGLMVSGSRFVRRTFRPLALASTTLTVSRVANGVACKFLVVHPDELSTPRGRASRVGQGTHVPLRDLVRGFARGNGSGRLPPSSA